LKDSSHNIEVNVWRGNGSGGEFHPYQVPIRENQTVLDVVTWIQRNLEPGLGYRFACRVGMCGSCAMEVNGRPRWSCRTHVNKVIDNNSLQISPLRNLPVIKDLACDMTVFFDKWVAAGGKFEGTATRDDSVAMISPDSRERIEASSGIECINCAVCYAACDVVKNNPEYLGPAALNRAWTLVNDVRDRDRSSRLKAVSGRGGCHNCHSQQSCQQYCPMELNPTASIAGLKRLSAKAALKGEL
jgi:fumarate reductase iron-sulfur subunit